MSEVCDILHSMIIVMNGDDNLGNDMVDNSNLDIVGEFYAEGGGHPFEKILGIWSRRVVRV